MPTTNKDFKHLGLLTPEERWLRYFEISSTVYAFNASGERVETLLAELRAFRASGYHSYAEWARA